jgi:hypothetical protein
MDSMMDSKEENQSKISQKRTFCVVIWEGDVLPLNYSRLSRNYTSPIEASALANLLLFTAAAP